MRYPNFFLISGFIVVLVLGAGAFFFFRRDGQHDRHQSMVGQHMSQKPAKKHKTAEYVPVHIDAQRQQLLGIVTEPIKTRALKKHIRTVGIVDVDETRVSIVQTKFNGWIEELFVDFTGTPVSKGQPLFTVYSPELHATQEEYLIARRAVLDRHEVFARSYKMLDHDLVRAARQRLELWDIPDDEIASLETTQCPTKTLTLRSPCSGIVLQKHAFIGMNVAPGMPIFTIADLSHVWILADAYEQDIPLIQLGQQGSVAPVSFPGQSVVGNVTFINYTVDRPTRTAKIRFECDNKNFALKPGMYATVEIEVPIGIGLALPEEALIDTGTRKIVFVATGKGVYEPREVQLGYKADAYYQIVSGLKDGELVVTSAQFLLDSESRIKASSGDGMHMHGM